MNRTPNASRLWHYMIAHGPLGEDLEERILDRVHRAGWSLDDPVSIQIAHDTLSEARMNAFLDKTGALPDRIEQATVRALRQVESQGRRDIEARQQVVAAAVTAEVARALQTNLPQLARSLRAHMAQKLAAIMLVLALLSLAGGYTLGRQEASRLGQDYAELALAPDGHRWLQLQSFNGDLDMTIAQYCRPDQQGHIPTEDGREACAVPLWLEGPAPSPAGAVTTGSRLRALAARLPVGTGVGLGLLFGIGLAFLFSRRK